MTALRKLLTIAVVTVALFLGAFATSFFAMKVAFADEAPPVAEEGAKSDEVHVVKESEEDPSKEFNFLGSPGEHYGKDVMGGKLGDGFMLDEEGRKLVDEEGRPIAEEAMSAPFIFAVLNFVLLLILLAWKGKPIVEKMAADRHDQIKTALDEAAKLRKQAADRLEEYASKLAAADAEIKSMLEGMRADAEADKKRILEAAERQATQMKHDADVRIAAEIELARAALTREVTYAATAAAEQLLRDKTTPSDQQQIIGAFITGVQDAASKEAR